MLSSCVTPPWLDVTNVLKTSLLICTHIWIPSITSAPLAWFPSSRHEEDNNEKSWLAMAFQLQMQLRVVASLGLMLDTPDLEHLRPFSLEIKLQVWT